MFVTKKKSHSSVWPPSPARSSENEADKKVRLSNEAEAKRVNDVINRELELELWHKMKEQGPKILLLGQAESGKSTVLKNFQLHFAPRAFALEVEIWRPVIHLNLVRSVNFIVTFALSKYQVVQNSYSKSHGQRKAPSGLISPEVRKICTRLAPLRQVEESLINLLSGRNFKSNYTNDSRSKAKPSDSGESHEHTITNSRRKVISLRRLSEESSGLSTLRSEDGQNRRIMAALGADILTLWSDAEVQQYLKAAGFSLQEQPGFFLDQVERITREDYKPCAEDIMKARVTTIGPEEHTIIAESGPEKAKHWTIYDVGGSRSQRAAWAQFFDDVNNIIFLAPMSGFNQVLAEDESVNRLSDSLRLWQTICSNKILAGVEFVLFLNKLDILDAKLKSGVQFSSFVTSYSDRPNETKSVSRYLLDVFISIHKQHSLKRRRIYAHLTCAVDTRATSTVIIRIREVILVELLTKTNML